MNSPINNKSLSAVLALTLSLCYIVLFQSGCKKLVEVDSPTTNITGDNVFTNDGTAAAMLTGLYTQMSLSDLQGGNLVSIGFLTGLSSDELTLYQGSNSLQLMSYYQNKLVPYLVDIWGNIYPVIYTANSAIERISPSNSLTLAVKRQLLGEAKFMRAFCYFYLVNLYGDIPLVVSTDYTTTSTLSRSPKDLVWQQIISDLKDAKELLSPDYLDGSLLKKTSERVRPTKWAATALLARCYLYTQDWKNSELQSTEVINNTSLYHLDSLNNVFLQNNWEAIWQLQPVSLGINTSDARLYVLNSDGLSGIKPVYLSKQLLLSFEPNDQRINNWTDTITLSDSVYHFAYKYKVDNRDAPVTEYHTILRLGEQFLIRAEARAQQNNIQGALDDLNLIRKRAWLSEVKVNNLPTLLTSIYHERRVELFTEWGHRWLDLKRNGTVNSVMSLVTPQKGGTWNSTSQLYPLPPRDILADGNLVQNPGY